MFVTAQVEICQYMERCNVNTLVWSVYYIWNCGNLNSVISRVFHHLEKVLCLINEGRGSNNLVESKCDLKFEGQYFDHEKNIVYHKELLIGFVDGIIAEDNVDNIDGGGKVEQRIDCTSMIRINNKLIVCLKNKHESSLPPFFYLFVVIISPLWPTIVQRPLK